MVEKDFSNLAPAIIITAEFDPLLSDGEEYAALLRRDNVPVIYRQFDGMIHGFFTNMAVTPTSKISIDFVAEELRKLTE
jgi:acetyl esterase